LLSSPLPSLSAEGQGTGDGEQGTAKVDLRFSLLYALFPITHSPFTAFVAFCDHQLLSRGPYVSKEYHCFIYGGPLSASLCVGNLSPD
jgi:hypothetical protein